MKLVDKGFMLFCEYLASIYVLILQAKVICLQKVKLIAYLIKEDTPQRLGLQNKEKIAWHQEMIYLHIYVQVYL